MAIQNLKVPALAAVVVLALSFGALAAVNIVSKAVLWDRLPFAEPERLVEMSGTFTEKGEVQGWAIGHLDFLDWRRQNQVFESMSAFTDDGGVAFNLLTPKGLERLDGELVSHTYLQTLGIQPALGRFFTAEEDGEPFVHPVTVLSYELWQRQFGGDRAIVGRTVNLSGKDWQVIGVGPEGFRGVSDSAQLWIPSSMVPGPEYIEVRRFRWLNVVARLKEGVTPQQAQAEMDRITAALAQQYPDQNRGIGVKIQPLRQFVYDANLVKGLRAVSLGAAIAFLLALIDAAGLLRLGTSDGRVPSGRSVAVCIVGMVAGLGLALWATRELLPTSGFTFPSFAKLSLSPALMAGFLVLAVLSGWWISLLSPRGRIGRSLLIAAAVVQVVLAVGLLAKAAMMNKDFRREASQDLGYRSEGLLTMRLDLTAPNYANDADVARLAGEYLQRLETLPEVESAAITGPAVATDNWVGAFVTAEDHDNPQSDDGTYRVLTHGVSPDYFKVMGIPLRRGRTFTWQDTQGRPVILSEAMARQIWPGQDPLGKRLKFSARKVQPRPWLTVVGVVADVRYQGLFAEDRPGPDFYLSVLQQPVRLPMILNVLARPKAGVAMKDLEAAMRRQILAVTADTPPYDVATLGERLAKQTWKARFKLRIASGFAGLALVLAAAALWGAVAGRIGEETGERVGEPSPASHRQAAH